MTAVCVFDKSQKYKTVNITDAYRNRSDVNELNSPESSDVKWLLYTAL